MVVINKKSSKILTGLLIVTGILAGSYLGIIESNTHAKAETIVIGDYNSNSDKVDYSMLNVESVNKDYFSHLEQWDKCFGWSKDGKLLFFKGVAAKSKEENIVVLEEKSEDGKLFKTHEIVFNLGGYNENLVSDYMTYESDFIENVKYIVSLSPDKEKVLISTEVINADPIEEDDYRITNKGFSAIYNLETEKVTFIDDNSRFVKWSSDSKYVFGINYAACYHKYVEAPYDRHFFPTYTYRNVSYSIEEEEIEVITYDKELYESLKISKETYDNILNSTDEDNKKRFLLGYTATETVYEPKFEVKNIPFNNKVYNMKFILDADLDNQYLFVGNDNLDSNKHGFPAIYLSDRDNKNKEELFESFILNEVKIEANDKILLYAGESIDSFNTKGSEKVLGLNMYDRISGRSKLLYEGDVGSFAYSSKSNNIAIYDDVKKKILIGKLEDDKITDLKSYYEVTIRAFDMYFNEDGTKLYFEGSYDDINGVIDINAEKVIECIIE